MPELKAGVTDTAVEKHVPVYILDGIETMGRDVQNVISQSEIALLKSSDNELFWHVKHF